MATSVLSASFAVFLVRERECHSKGVQVVAGASPSAFWSAAYAWDLLNFSLPTLGIHPSCLSFSSASFSIKLWLSQSCCQTHMYGQEWHATCKSPKSNAWGLLA